MLGTCPQMSLYFTKYIYPENGRKVRVGLIGISRRPRVVCGNEEISAIFLQNHHHAPMGLQFPELSKFEKAQCCSQEKPQNIC